MKSVSIILAHPKPGSFNHAIAEAAAGVLQKYGVTVSLHDLYAEAFDPLLDPAELTRDYKPEGLLKRHCDEIVQADGILVIHPNWWGQPPAILKGWVDRVIRQGLGYRFETNDKGEGVPVGLFKNKSAVVLTTSNTPEEREREVFGNPLENFWKTCVFGFCGVERFYYQNFGVVVVSSTQQRQGWLEQTARVCEKLS
ncbi:MAG: NAD(P)H-dependent oxidoreductase [Candidatus Omnitrophota bacterium]